MYARAFGSMIVFAVLTARVTAAPAVAATLPDATTANAASKCQHGILQAGSKFVTAKLGNLQTCTNVILKCIETKIGDKKCLAAASRKCTGNFAKILASEVSFANAIKNACKSVSSTDLAAEVGLAYGRDHDTCLEDFGADVGTRDGVVTCIVRQHARTAEELFSVQQARTIKLLDAAGVARTTLCDVPANPDCDDCETSNPPDAGKSIVACAAAIAKAGTGFVKATIAAITKCTKASFACAVTPSTPEKTAACNAKATTACSSAFAGFAAARDKADVAIETNKSCKAVPFSLLVQKSALNLDALAADCTTAQSGTLPNIEAYATCVHQRHECDVKALAPFAAPRLDDLLGGVGVPDPLCPNAGAVVAARALDVSAIAEPLLAAADGVSTGNIGDIIGTITRPGPGGATGQHEGGFKAPTSGATNSVNGASSSTFTFAPGRPKPVKIAYTRCGDQTTTPRLIVAAKDEHGDFVADHFAVDLPKPSDDSTDAEVEVTFQPSVRSCVRLAFATECGSGPNAFVSSYVRLPQVPEVVAQETETPTPAPIETPTGTATATIAAPSVTATPSSTPSASPTPSRTATASPGTATPSGTPTASQVPTVTPTPAGNADLTGTALGPATAVAGQTATLTWTVKNQGTAGAPASTWTDAVYLSTNNTFDAGDTPLTSMTNPSALAPGTSYTISVGAGIPIVTPGSYFLILRVDSGNGVGEADETNNVRVTPITITAPDLTPTALAASPAVAGQPLTITWTVANQGTGDAPVAASSDAVYLSTDAVLDLSDVVLAAVTNPIAVAPGASYTSSATPTLPQIAAGSYFLILRVDSGNGVFESVESNNLSVIPITITAPDVVPTALTASTAVGGQPLTLNWTVANQGSGVAPVNTWNDTVYLSTDNVLDLGDVALASAVNPLSLAAGGTYTRAATTTLPNIAAGAYFLILRVDSGNSLFESNEGNNLRVIPMTVGTPDLVPTALTTSAPIAGQTATFTWTVTNQGSGGAPAATWSDFVYLSTDDVLDAGDVMIASPGNPVSVAAGASYTTNVNATFPSVAPGDYFLILRVDASNQLFESNEGNNLRVVPITVTAPDLVPTALMASAATLGQPLVINWTVVNQGTGAAPAVTWTDSVYLSTDNVLDGNDVALANVANPTALAPGATYMVTTAASIPAVAPGSYFLIIRVNNGNGLFESNTGNDTRVIAITVKASPTPTVTPTGGATPTPTPTPLPDLVATALGPSAAVAGQALTFTWTVANQGAASVPAQTYYDAVYLSTDNVFDVGDTPLQFIPNPIAFAGESYSQNVYAAMPNVPPGNYFLILRTDDSGSVVESNEANNIRVSPITITAPDLAPTTLALGGPAVAGQAVTAGFTVANQGTGSAPPSTWIDQIYLSKDDTLDGGDTPLNSSVNPRGLAPGASYVQYLSVAIPNVTPGSYFLILRTDSTGSLFESNEANNVLVQPITVSAPDLTSTALSVAAPVVAGQAVTVSWTVTNQGTGNAPSGGWSDNVYLSTNNVFDINDTQLTSNGNPRALAPGESYTQYVSVAIPNVAPGSYFLILRVDGNANLFESDEANNVRVIPITITAVDLAPTALAPATAVAGQAAPLSWTVTNQGTGTAPGGTWTDSVYLSTDNVFDVSDVPLTGNVNPTKLDPGGSYTQYVATTIPNVPPGNYFLILRVDGGNSVPESNEGNNARVTPITITAPDLVPTALGPATAVAGQPTTVSWSVTNQGSGAASNAWSDYVYLSTDNVLDFGDILLASVANPIGLLPGAAYTTGTGVTIPSVPPGDYFLILRVDIGSAVFESSEANNARVTPITIN